MKWRHYLSIFVFLFAARNLEAQIQLDSNETFPPHPDAHTWHLDKREHQLWHWKNKWELVNDAIDSIVSCHCLIGIWSLRTAWVYEQGGSPVFPSISDFECRDSIAVVHIRANDDDDAKRWQATNLYFYDPQCRLRVSLLNFRGPFRPTMVQGIEAWCLPNYNFGTTGKQIVGDQLHQWGMLGSNGKWLIEPLYDTFFYFRNGTAEVLYYGQKRKINEKGEFVE